MGFKGKAQAYLNSLGAWGGHGDFKLDTIRAILDPLGNPQDKINSIHVAGTNGKGSICAAIAAIMGAEGRVVGLTISPHLEDIRERIVIDGDPIKEELFESVVEEIAQVSEHLGLKPSFFEAVTATAFQAFWRCNLDVAVIETGLGGRLDATNIIKKPSVTIISSIDLDHMPILGATREKIAFEKAGIIKRDVPVILGEVGDGSATVIEAVAKQNNSTVRRLGREFRAEGGSSGGKFTSSWGESFFIRPALHGEHQLKNMAVAFEAAKIAGASNTSCLNGISSVFWPGRFEISNINGLKIIVDSAHNPHGIKALAKTLAEDGIRDLKLGFGALDTKDWLQMIDILAPFCKECVVAKPDSDRGVSPAEIVNRLSCLGIKGSVASSAEELVDRVTSIPGETALFTGSIYLIGKVRVALRLKGLGFKAEKIWARYITS